MASLNKKIHDPVTTHGGAPTYAVNAEEQLYRAVMTCLLWEPSFYESGDSTAARIKDLIPKVDPLHVAQIAIDARTLMKLRHVPLYIAREMARLDTHKHLVGRLLPQIIQRPDELTEFMAIWNKEKRQPLSAQAKKGLAEALKAFNEYSLQKYNKDGTYKLRDVVFLTHPKPDNAAQQKLWDKLVKNELATPETWETLISAKGNKKENWEHLLKENKLGDLALIRNLRNFVQAGVTEKLVIEALSKMKGTRVLPFRYLSAAAHAPKYEPALEQAFLRSIEGKEKLKGKTILIVDVSGSMYGSPVSAKSEVDRAKAACAMAVLVRELCENPVIYATAGNDHSRVHATSQVPSRRGFALSEAIYNMSRPLGGGGIFLEQVMAFVKKQEHTADRVIVITDEQDCSGTTDAPSRSDAFGTHNYIVNVNTYEHGIAYGKFTHINGWSEAVLDYIKISEEGYKVREVSKVLTMSKQELQAPKVVPSVTKKRVVKKKVVKSAKKVKRGKAGNRGPGKRVSRNGSVRKGSRS